MNQEFIRFLQNEVQFVASKAFVDYIMGTVDPEDRTVKVRKYDMRTNELGGAIVYVQSESFSFEFTWTPGDEIDLWTMGNSKIVGFFNWLKEDATQQDTPFPDGKKLENPFGDLDKRRQM